MLFASDFSYQGVNRLGFGFDNPNVAAAIIVAAMPFCWAMAESRKENGQKSELWSLSICAEALGSFALLLTMSRGGIVAWAGALGFYAFAGSLKFRHLRAASFPWRFLITRGAVGGLSLYFMKAGSRIAAGFRGDPSVTHRIDLWRGALHLIAARPWAGWGWGNSGSMYTSLFQPLASDTIHHGLVNGYLQLGVEYGLFAVALLVFVLSFAIISLARPEAESGHRRELWHHALATSIIGYSMAAWFTTLLHSRLEFGILLAVAVYCSLLIWRRDRRLLILPVSVSLGTATCSCLFLYLAGMQVQEASYWRVTSTIRGIVDFTSRESNLNSETIDFYPDRRCLGPNYGKAIREVMGLVTERPRASHFRIHIPGAAPSPALSEKAFVFGASCEGLADINANKFVLIAPIGNPPVDFSGPAEIVVASPEFDEFGYSEPWRKWGGAKGSRKGNLIIRNVGQDIRSEWKNIFGVLNGADR